MRILKIFFYFEIIFLFVGCGNIGVTDTNNKNIKIIEGKLINAGPVYNTNVCIKTNYDLHCAATDMNGYYRIEIPKDESEFIERIQIITNYNTIDIGPDNEIYTSDDVNFPFNFKININSKNSINLITSINILYFKGLNLIPNNKYINYEKKENLKVILGEQFLKGMEIKRDIFNILAKTIQPYIQSGVRYNNIHSYMLDNNIRNIPYYLLDYFIISDYYINFNYPTNLFNIINNKLTDFYSCIDNLNINSNNFT